MKRWAGLLVGVASLLLLGGCASERQTAKPVAGMLGEQQTTVTATVEKIDLGQRLVTLRGPKGTSVPIHVDERVKNLAQVRVGDQVVATYYESIAYEVKKPGQAAPGVSAAGGVAAAPPGQKPAGLAARAVTVTATIAAIDKDTPSVTLRRPDGELVAVKVRDPKKLERVAVGDLVEITYTEALAISVQPMADK